MRRGRDLGTEEEDVGNTDLGKVKGHTGGHRSGAEMCGLAG